METQEGRQLRLSSFAVYVVFCVHLFGTVAVVLLVLREVPDPIAGRLIAFTIAVYNGLIGLGLMIGAVVLNAFASAVDDIRQIAANTVGGLAGKSVERQKADERLNWMK